MCLCRGSEVGRGMLVGLVGNGIANVVCMGAGNWVVGCVGWGSGVVRWGCLVGWAGPIVLCCVHARWIGFVLMRMKSCFLSKIISITYIAI